MRGRGGNEEEAPARETEGTDSEVHDFKSPTPPETVEPLYEKSVYEILLGGPDRREAEPGREEREALPDRGTHQTQRILQVQRALRTMQSPLFPKEYKA